MRLTSCLIALSIFACSEAIADTVAAPNSFSNGSVADADHVNANFTALVDESNENDTRLGVLEGGKFTTPYISLSNNDAGARNTIFGLDAGANILFDGSYSGDDNSAFGYHALFSNTTGYENTAIGVESLYSNTTGYYNTAIGIKALYSNTTAIANTAIGHKALEDNTTGEKNTATGYRALAYNTEGNNNTGNGRLALYQNTTGSNNTGIGYLSLYKGSLSDNNTAIGYQALAGKVPGSNNTVIGADADITIDNLFNATVIGYNAKANASNKIRLGDANVTVIEGQVAFSFTSDRRLKEDIQTTSLGLDFVNDLNPVQYHRINNRDADIEMGVIAQELTAVLAKHNASDSGMVNQVGDSSMSVRYNDLFAPLIKSVQELSTENEALKAEMAELKAMVLDITNN